MHPALRAFLTISLMIFGIAWGLNHFMGVPAPETPRAQIPSEPQPQAQPQPQAHDDRPLDQAQPQQEALYPSEPAEPPQLEDIVVVEPEGSGRGGSPGQYWVYISKGDYTLSLYRGNELVKNYSVAVGRFRVQSIENSQSWKHDFGDGNGVIDGAYGPWFIRLNTD